MSAFPDLAYPAPSATLPPSMAKMQLAFDTPIRIPANAYARELFAEGTRRARGGFDFPGLKIPEQEFTIEVTANRIVITNTPAAGWPIVRLHIAKELGGLQFKLNTVDLEHSTDEVLAEVLLTRLCLYAADAGSLPLWLRVGKVRLNLEMPFGLPPSSVEDILRRASIARKLHFVALATDARFVVRGELSGRELAILDVVFRGLADGSYERRTARVMTFTIAPDDFDVTQLPAEGVGRFVVASRHFGVSLFGADLLLGPVTFAGDAAEVAGPLSYKGLGGDAPVTVRLVLLDHRVRVRFEAECGPGEDERRRERFSHYLRQLAKEEGDLARLVEERLDVDVGALEAEEIGDDWLRLHAFPDRFAAQEAVALNDDTWRVPIWFVYTSGRGDRVGDLLVDRKDARVSATVSPDEMMVAAKSVARALSDAS